MFDGRSLDLLPDLNQQPSVPCVPGVFLCLDQVDVTLRASRQVDHFICLKHKTNKVVDPRCSGGAASWGF